MTGKEIQLFRDNIANEDYLQQTILVTLKDIYSIMKECYGPYGSHILIDTKIRPEATKDGKTILSSISMSGSISSAVLRAITDVADKQVEEVGDGSTTTILLLCELYTRFREIIKKYKLTPSSFQKSIYKITSIITNELNNSAESIVTYVNNEPIINFDRLRESIYTSVDADTELTNIILDMFKELNCVEPMILIENSNTTEHHYELVKGTEVDGAIINSDIFLGGFSRQTYENPKIIVINGRFEMNPDRYLELVNNAARDGTAYIILCCGVSEELMNVVYNMNMTSPGSFVNVPIFQIRETAISDTFRDLCAALGATPIDSESTKKYISSATMMRALDNAAGSCAKSLVTEFCVRFNDPNSNDAQLKERIAEIESKIKDIGEDPTSHNDTISSLEERKAFLSKKFAKLYVGGASPQRKAINFELANDGIPQAISSMKHGVVPGCNTAVPKIVDAVLDNKDINLTEPERDILRNIGFAYRNMFVQLVANAIGEEYAPEFVDDHISKNGYTPIDLRVLASKDETESNVINSANTDKAILKYSTDMASLLCTSKGFLSIKGTNEFDITQKPNILNG